MSNANLAALLLLAPPVLGCSEQSDSHPDDTTRDAQTGESPTSLAPSSAIDPGPTVGATTQSTGGSNSTSSDEPSSTDSESVDDSGLSGGDVSSGTSTNGGATGHIDTSDGESGVSASSDNDAGLGGGSTSGERPGWGDSSQNPADGGITEEASGDSGESPADADNPATPPVTFRNPLNASHGSDPWMTYYDGYYYLAATTWGDTLTMKRGRTLEELKQTSPSVIWQDATASRCCNMWAPEFYLVDGPNGPRWYHYYTAGDGNDLGTQRSHVLESEGLDPMGPYHYRGRLLDYWAIDGSILETSAGRYFTFSSWDGPTQNIYIMAMADPWTLTGSRTLLTFPEHAWEREGSDPVNEGSAALYHDGRTFVTYSASQCADAGYKLGLLELTGDDALDPGSWWKSPQPVFQAANGAYGSAHNGFFVSPDGTESWLVYHATINPAGSCWTDRTTRVQPFTWNEDDTPNFGAPLPLDADIPVPSGE